MAITNKILNRRARKLYKKDFDDLCWTRQQIVRGFVIREKGKANKE